MKLEASKTECKVVKKYVSVHQWFTWCVISMCMLLYHSDGRDDWPLAQILKRFKSTRLCADDDVQHDGWMNFKSFVGSLSPRPRYLSLLTKTFAPHSVGVVGIIWWDYSVTRSFLKFTTESIFGCLKKFSDTELLPCSCLWKFDLFRMKRCHFIILSHRTFVEILILIGWNKNLQPHGSLLQQLRLNTAVCSITSPVRTS